jgi:hypothetical protein
MSAYLDEARTPLIQDNRPAACVDLGMRPLLGNTVLCLDEHPEVRAQLQSSRPAMYRSPSDEPDRIPAPAQCASAVRVR